MGVSPLGGGVTLSGGEPLSHPDFCLELAKLCKEHDVNLAIETSGYVNWDILETMSPYVDIFLYDVKLVSEDKRIKWLATEEKIDLKNLKNLAKIHHHIVIRIPLIPSVNDGEDEFEKIMKHVDEIGGIKDVQILPFHQFGEGKYEIAGMPYSMCGWNEDNNARIEACRDIAKKHGYRVDIGGKGITQGR